MRDRLPFVAAGLFILASLGFVVWFNAVKPRVLVLNSYDNGYSWTRDVVLGARRVLDTRPHLAVRWYYMDTKRHPGAEFKTGAGARARRQIEAWRPDVIIAVDDDAQEYVARHYVNDPRIHIVFAGVNGEVEPYGYNGAANVTGILERKPLQGVKEVIQSIGATRPGGKRVVHIGDTSSSVGKDDKFIRAFDWAPLQLMGSKLVEDFAQWQAAVRWANENADYVITTNYRKLTRSATDQALVAPEEVVAWTEANCRLPLIGTNGFFVEDGGMLATGTSPYEQGEVAAEMALQIIERRRRPADIPVQSSRQFVVFTRESSLREHGIVLPQVYEAFARATNNHYR